MSPGIADADRDHLHEVGKDLPMAVPVSKIGNEFDQGSAGRGSVARVAFRSLRHERLFRLRDAHGGGERGNRNSRPEGAASQANVE